MGGTHHTAAGSPSAARTDPVQTRLSGREKLSVAAIGVGVALALFWGWHVFWFLTDDAYIAFRYVSNSIFGYGYVWNPAPFRPVEGYTSFLWVVLLDGIWRVFRIEPPDAANPLALAFAALTLGLGARMMLTMRLNHRLARHRVLLLGLVGLGVVTNRTFLTWASSGLETAMFNFLLIAWVVSCLLLPVYSRGWTFATSSLATLVYLARPDGLLVALVTVFLFGCACYARSYQGKLTATDLLAVLPLLGIPLHLLWRLRFYGATLPNTYYAKAIPGRVWVDSGVRYVGSFLIEYSFWLWFVPLIGLTTIAFGRSVRRPGRILLLDMGIADVILGRDEATKQTRSNGLARLPVGWLLGTAAALGLGLLLNGEQVWGMVLIGLALIGVLLLGVLRLTLVQAAVVATLLLHFGYYTFVIGGDHFEWRVYSHLILLLFVSFVWLLDRLGTRPVVTVASLILFVVLSWPIPWTHWSLTHTITERTGSVRPSIAQVTADRFPQAPQLLIGYLRSYDDMQSWLIGHAVGMRHQEHKLFHELLVRVLPTREQGLAMSDEEFLVTANPNVGVIAWVLPKVNVIDTLGLNDYVIARVPVDSAAGFMAHERHPPPGYVECFAPNVEVIDLQLLVHPRPVELTADKIAECEQHFMQIVTNAGN
jgi:arabinofuranosyltransferase